MSNPTTSHEREITSEELPQFTVEDITTFTRELSVRDCPDNRIWFRNMLIGILNLTHNNFLGVEMGAGRMPLFASWGARNLLELRVITKYVLQSEENAAAFQNDMAADIKEFWLAVHQVEKEAQKRAVTNLRNLASRESGARQAELARKADELEQGSPDPSGAKKEMENSLRVIQERGLDAKRKPKHGTAIAKLIDESEMFDPRFKMFSKLVHPTALSIAANVERDSLLALKDLTVTMASSDVTEIFMQIKTHVEAYGLNWPV
jgi:hypothetical protein